MKSIWRCVRNNTKTTLFRKFLFLYHFETDQQMLNSYDELQCGARGVLYIVVTPLVWSGCPEFSQVNERKKKLPVFFFLGGGGREYMYFPYFFFTITLLI